MSRIGIIGQGFVGNSLKEGLIKDYPDIMTFDLREELRNTGTLEEVVRNCYFIFVCVPTPMRKDGSCFTGIVESVIEEIDNVEWLPLTNGAKRIIILKTTIPPGTTEKLQKKYDKLSFVFNPEFLTEANAVNDFKNQNRILLGGSNSVDLNRVADLYRKTFPFIPIVHLTSQEAEMAKYVTNIFLATKVTFANEMYKICEAMGVNYENVVNAAKLDKRIGDSHWRVPGPDGDFGFGGHCFPKDTQAIQYEASQLGIDTTLISAVLEKNNKIRKNKDWEKQIGRSII